LDSSSLVARKDIAWKELFAIASFGEHLGSPLA